QDQPEEFVILLHAFRIYRDEGEAQAQELETGPGRTPRQALLELTVLSSGLVAASRGLGRKTRRRACLKIPKGPVFRQALTRRARTFQARDQTSAWSILVVVRRRRETP